MSEKYKANFTMRQLFESGVHYGHKKNLWNPQMSPYIYGVRNGIHIIDLRQTYVLLNAALSALRDVALKNGRILFVGTKKQASEAIAENAKRCGQYYVNHRWLGGMLTNWTTVSKSIKTLKQYEDILVDEETNLTKKELLGLSRKRIKLDNVLGGIRNIGGTPDILFVLDSRDQEIAILEANKLRIPVIGIVDTNTSLEGIDYIIPGNDDSEKSIKLYCELAADAILDGMQVSMTNAGVDISAVEGMEMANIEFDDVPQERSSGRHSRGKAGAGFGGNRLQGSGERRAPGFVKKNEDVAITTEIVSEGKSTVVADGKPDMREAKPALVVESDVDVVIQEEAVE